MSSHRQGNDRSGRPRLPPRGPRAGPEHAASAGHRRRLEDVQAEWLWGTHSVAAALANPARGPVKRLVATAERAAAISRRADAATVEVLDNQEIARLLPAGAVHQGIALRIPPLDPTALETLAQGGPGFLLMLDQVTDPQNVGAAFRSAAAFGARGVILQDRHAPALAGALAKAAAGGLDAVPHARETNLSRALETLETMGWRAVGLDGTAGMDLADALDGTPTVLVVGSEGGGLRRLVAEHCDALARIPMPGAMESLNVAAAVAVACYEAARVRL
ncbi:MAG: RNA methyltransferase [Caulobacteraceae bacterium]